MPEIRADLLLAVSKTGMCLLKLLVYLNALLFWFPDDQGFFYNFILNTHVSAVYFRKKINGLIGVMVLTLVMTSLLPKL